MAARTPSGASKGHEMLLSFNLAPRQLWSAHLSEKLIGRLRDAGVTPRRVMLDIAEATAMADPERAQKVMAELQCWGLKLAIDDFGTAHSSFARLVNFPVDFLKIDRQFVRGVDVEPGQAAVVRAIVALADSLAISPVAVGVETEGEAEFLRRLGVPLAQGFLFGRPVVGERAHGDRSRGRWRPDEREPRGSVGPRSGPAGRRPVAARGHAGMPGGGGRRRRDRLREPSRRSAHRATRPTT